MRMFSEILADVATEEELKNFFAKYFRIKLSTKNYIDLYTAQILFEFKFDASLTNIQMLYYIRHLKFGNDIRTPSKNTCIVTRGAAIFFPTEKFSAFIRHKIYDWDLAPSSLCMRNFFDKKIPPH